MAQLILEELYTNLKRVVVTAHRGFSSRYPENTLPAFAAAVQVGADLVEFDLRGTRERIPVVMHDSTLERVSDGSGPVAAYTLKQLKELDFAFCWKKTNASILLPELREKIPVPTFKETLDHIPDSVGLNIELKDMDPPFLHKVCDLFDSYMLYSRAYLTVSTFSVAEVVRTINSEIEICILERKYPLDLDMLKRMKDFGCRFLQPHRRDITRNLCAQIREMGFWANLFYSNTDEDNRHFIGYGIQGIITDAPDVLRDSNIMT